MDSSSASSKSRNQQNAPSNRSTHESNMLVATFFSNLTRQCFLVSLGINQTIYNVGERLIKSINELDAWQVEQLSVENLSTQQKEQISTENINRIKSIFNELRTNNAMNEILSISREQVSAISITIPSQSQCADESATTDFIQTQINESNSSSSQLSDIINPKLSSNFKTLLGFACLNLLQNVFTSQVYPSTTKNQNENLFHILSPQSQTSVREFFFWVKCTLKKIKLLRCKNGRSHFRGRSANSSNITLKQMYSYLYNNSD